MENKKEKFKITRRDICLIVGIMMVLAGVYWMWLSNDLPRLPSIRPSE